MVNLCVGTSPPWREPRRGPAASVIAQLSYCAARSQTSPLVSRASPTRFCNGDGAATHRVRWRGPSCPTAVSGPGCSTLVLVAASRAKHSPATQWMLSFQPHPLPVQRGGSWSNGSLVLVVPGEKRPGPRFGRYPHVRIAHIGARSGRRTALPDRLAKRASRRRRGADCSDSSQAATRSATTTAAARVGKVSCLSCGDRKACAVGGSRPALLAVYASRWMRARWVLG
jgi:hypothetical protein